MLWHGTCKCTAPTGSAGPATRIPGVTGAAFAQWAKRNHGATSGHSQCPPRVRNARNRPSERPTGPPGQYGPQLAPNAPCWNPAGPYSGVAILSRNARALGPDNGKSGSKARKGPEVPVT